MSALLSVEGLSVSYRRGGAAIRAVDAVDLAVPAGAMLGLVGESGCGKSTLAQAVMGVLPGNAWISGGSVRLSGEDLISMTPEYPRSLNNSRFETAQSKRYCESREPDIV